VGSGLGPDPGLSSKTRPANWVGSVIVVLEPVAVFYMVYHYTKRTTLTRLLGNVGPAIYVVL